MTQEIRYVIKKNSATKKCKVVKLTGESKGKNFIVKKRQVLHTKISFKYAEELVYNLRK